MMGILNEFVLSVLPVKFPRHVMIARLYGLYLPPTSEWSLVVTAILDNGMTTPGLPKLTRNTPNSSGI